MFHKLGTYFFRYRNIIGPIVFLAAIYFGTSSYPMNLPSLNLAFDIAGISIALLGQGLRIITIGYEYIERGGRNRQVYASKLITGGVFSHCRNPLYVGNILLAVGLALVVHSSLFYLTVLPFVLIAYISIVSAEETYLQEKFGDDYSRYCKNVNRWLPNFRGWKRTISLMTFNWKRVVVKEYNTMFVVVLALALAKYWSGYQVQGIAVVPDAGTVMIAFAVWLSSYVFVRNLKKSGKLTA
ncbi:MULTISPECIES: isoprenylcysteine carboxylmethyltransferase family protein [Massilia]|jgi:protein-S-isoprenylcysteine O-methyltransferase Ste14|uniref:methyltransferase family protein n=1 Tax=Massilia TaxID=149698 RepID=UPI001C62B6F0|nr:MULTISPECIES: isoprenylcysteine carboxylmethyltransferase family protein [Massilia]QYF99969.1 isoprenylcysteine carboxylmethyltransferase family protein [Massilia sp. NP310]